MQCRLSLKIVGRYNERYNTKVYTQTTLSPKAFSQGLCFGAFMLFIYVIMDKKSVLLYLDSLNVLDSLTDEQAWKLIKKIRAYSAWLEYDPKEQLIDVVFVQFKNYIDVNTEKYNGICEKNKDNVRKRWDKENTTVYDRIPLDTKHTDKDTDTDTDKNKDIEKEKFSFDSWWSLYPLKEWKKKAIEYFDKKIKTQQDYDNLMRWTNGYIAVVKVKRSTGFALAYRQGDVFLNKDTRLEYLDWSVEAEVKQWLPLDKIMNEFNSDPRELEAKRTIYCGKYSEKIMLQAQSEYNIKQNAWFSI